MNDPEKLEDRTKMLARSLNIKVDPSCFDKPINEQATCLTTNTSQMVLTDDHSQSMVSTDYLRRLRRSDESALLQCRRRSRHI